MKATNTGWHIDILLRDMPSQVNEAVFPFMANVHNEFELIAHIGSRKITSLSTEHVILMKRINDTAIRSEDIIVMRFVKDSNDNLLRNCWSEIIINSMCFEHSPIHVDTNLDNIKSVANKYLGDFYGSIVEPFVMFSMNVGGKTMYAFTVVLTTPITVCSVEYCSVQSIIVNRDTGELYFKSIIS